jgi:hypothetical protein
MKHWMFGVLIFMVGMLPTDVLSQNLECLPDEDTSSCLQKAISEINRLSSELDTLRSEHQIDIQRVLQEVAAVRSTADDALYKAGQCESRLNTLWINGSMCVLSNGTCPAGFTRRSGHMRAIRIFMDRNNPGYYLGPVNFGDSRISWHGYPYQYGEYAGELLLSACCK